MPNYLGDIDILNSKYYYRKLDEGWDGCEIYAFYNKAKTVLEGNNGLQDVSDQILKALCYVYKNSLRNTLYSDMCNVLYFWLGNIFLENLVTKDLFHEVILNLFDSLKNHNQDKVCTAPHFFMLKKDFNVIKTIFDCSEDYKSYSKHLLSFGMSCSNKYKSYLDTNTDNYNKFYNECEVEKKGHEYCEEFRKYFPHYKKNLFSEFNCSLKLNKPESEEFVGGHNTELMQLQGERSNRGLQKEKKLSVPHRSGVEHQAVSPGLSVTESETGVVQKFPSSDYSDSTPPSIISKSVTGAVSVAGAIVPSYLLYNYTPAGNMINKLLGRRTRMNHNPLTEAQLMDNFYQPEGFNSERSGYNISYRPV
ncbi:PIR protein [Plasmodium vivax]|uniref:VIR protein n=1 Tax=Plasmodium vivax TaxID=5855 RepID=A0A565A5Q6_PLAVI|nr:PIR protein [Plasmodium vivax]